MTVELFSEVETKLPRQPAFAMIYAYKNFVSMKYSSPI